MAINIHQAKKRDRADMTRMMMAAPAASGTTTPSSSFDQQEYDRAVAFLRELRSRPVDPASAAVASRLETVVEDDGGLEEMMLAADFTLALSVVGRSQPTSGKPSSSMKRRHHRSRSSGSNGRRGVLLGLGASRMKKTATVKCLLDLDDDSSSSSGDEKSTSSSSMAFVQPRECDIISNDYCLGYDVITSSPPTSKRQRSRLVGRCSSV